MTVYTQGSTPWDAAARDALLRDRRQQVIEDAQLVTAARKRLLDIRRIIDDALAQLDELVPA